MVPWEELLEGFKDETGFTQVQPLEERLRRFALDAERELGFNDSLVYKRITYTNDGVNFDGTRMWLPKDWMFFDNVVENEAEIPINNYVLKGNYLHFCDGQTRETVQLYYYSLLHDGHGQPIISRNHKQAIISYWKWKVFGPRAYASGDRRMRDMEKSYEDDWQWKRDEAIGDDVWPSNKQEWSYFSFYNSLSTMQTLIYNIYQNAPNRCALEASETCVLREVELDMKVYHWQYGNTVQGIANAPSIDLSWLNTNTEESTLGSFRNGITLPFNQVGRIGIAVQGGSQKDYKIYDVLGNDITNTVFDFYRNEALKLDIFITKEFVSHSNIFFKLVKA